MEVLVSNQVSGNASFFELIWIQSGRGKTRIGNKVDQFSENEIYGFAGGIRRSFYPEQQGLLLNRCTFVTIRIQHEGLMQYDEKGDLERLYKLSHFGVVYSDFSFIHLRDTFRTIQNEQGLKQLQSFLNIIFQVFECNNFRTIASIPAQLSTNKPREIQSDSPEISALILSAYLDPDFDLSKAEQVMGYSKSTIEYQVKKLFQLTFGALLLKLRLQHACVLLQKEESKIEAIAYRSGFTNLSYFNRSFLKMYGYTPSAFRKQQRLLIGL